MPHTIFCQNYLDNMEGLKSPHEHEGEVIIVRLDREISDKDTAMLWQEYLKVVGRSQGGRLIFFTPTTEIQKK